MRIRIEPGATRSACCRPCPLHTKWSRDEDRRCASTGGRHACHAGGAFSCVAHGDRYLRFGSPFGPTAISAYVDRIDFDRDTVFGVYGDRLELGGVAHVAFGDDLAELALSVLPAYRRRGIGNALFKRALAHACGRCVSRLVMYFLSENAPITRIAQRFGMDIAADDVNADAPAPSAAV